MAGHDVLPLPLPGGVDEGCEAGRDPLAESPLPPGQVEEGVQGDPDHAGQGQTQPEDLGPGRVVVVAVGDGAVGHQVEDEDAGHDGGAQELPAEIEEEGRLVSGHRLDRLPEPLGSEDPGDGDGLPEADPEQGHPAGRVEVHQLEDEDPALGAHRDAGSEAEEADQHGELLPVGTEQLRPVVNQSSHQRLHVTELTVHTQDLKFYHQSVSRRVITVHKEGTDQQHDEEDRCPEERRREGEDELRVGEEDEAGAGPDDAVDGEVVDGGHVAEDGEHEDPGGEAGAGVDDAGDESVPVAVVVELVVGAQGRQGPGAHTVCEEYLCGSVYPG